MTTSTCFSKYHLTREVTYEREGHYVTAAIAHLHRTLHPKKWSQLSKFSNASTIDSFIKEVAKINKALTVALVVTTFALVIFAAIFPNLPISVMFSLFGIAAVAGITGIFLMQRNIKEENKKVVFGYAKKKTSDPEPTN